MLKTKMRGAHLSQLQERFWEFWKENHVYQVQCALSLAGKLNERACLRALQQMVDQHEILRTAFYCQPGMDTPIQAIYESSQVCCPVVNLEDLRPELQHALLEQSFLQLQEQPFDLARGLQLRTVLFRFSATTHQLFLGLPALSADSATLSLFCFEWSQYYQDYVNDQRPVLEEEPLQYIDIATWQDELLTEEHSAAQQELWRNLDSHSIVHQPVPFEERAERREQVVGGEPPTTFEPATFPFALE